MKKSVISESLFQIRHSLAHLLAEVVLELRPGSQLGFGPPIEEGFYYDFILSSPLSEKDFPLIEEKMRQRIAQGLAFQKEELPVAAALERLEAMQQPYKVAYARELAQKEGLSTLTFYQSGSFVDLCEGPHVVTSHQLPARGFRLRSLAGAYWRGDSSQVMMTRLYAWAFETEEELNAAIEAHEKAQERDHKKLGRELEIFFLDDQIGKGLPLWLPNGTVIRDELEKLMRELEFRQGYQRVITPHLARTELYYQTGHLPYYASHMFPVMKVDDAETYCLRPMNCPHHHRVFASKGRSYRDLPLRLAEYGQVYRFEDSGALSGLLRVRGLCINDAHIYCTRDQIKEEFLKVLELHQEVYRILQIQSYSLRLSTWDPQDPQRQEKFLNQPEGWLWTQDLLREILQEHGRPFEEGKGEAAFYGPKVDFQFRSVTGREETASTCQLDFGVAQRLGLAYVGPDNREHPPYIIHRAPLGTHERFVAFLLEHFGGVFPVWLAPVQVRVLPVSEAVRDYARTVEERLRGAWVRVEQDASAETLGKRLRAGVLQKIPYLLILGEKEQREGMVTVREYGKEAQRSLTLESFQDQLVVQIRDRLPRQQESAPQKG